MSEIINGADQAAVVGMLAKFAADRATSDSVADAKEGKYFKRQTINTVVGKNFSSNHDAPKSPLMLSSPGNQGEIEILTCSKWKVNYIIQ